jgi:2'-5' RNA ligase
LFVALPVPATIAGQLTALQPSPCAGQGWLLPADMHVTLHFLGHAQAEPVSRALERVLAPAFTVELRAPGSFMLRGGRRILWIGVEPSAPLTDLHRQIGSHLASLGFSQESRPYVPHITLARLSARQAIDILPEFSRQALPPDAGRFRCEKFALYASLSTPDGARYRVLRCYPLTG